MSGLIVDSFAGGGGASTGIEMALGRAPDVAINHDAAAIAVHAANHPETEHLTTNVWRVDPDDIVRRHGRPVDLLWASPDCTDHSKAKGGRPVRQHIRDLAWVVVLWARRARPRVICLENVEEFREWGPLTAEGRRCPERKGQTFDRWTRELRRLGYRVEWRELRACDYGAPTIRKRLFVIARRDGLPIVWPAPTHGPGRARPWRTAAEIIDWSLPCPSIFERKRPLAEATCRRIARGIVRYVIEAQEPFVVRIDHQSSPSAMDALGDPLTTITSKARHGLIVPTLVQTGWGERPGQAPRVPGLEKPLGTAVAGGPKHALVAAFLAQHNTGMTGHDARRPVSTLTQRCTQQQLVASHLVKLRNNCDGQDLRAPLDTVTSGGKHFGEVRAFLVKYYGTAIGQGLRAPLHSATAKARFGVVTVEIAGATYAIADIGMRMLSPRELFRAQGFPDGYKIDPVVNGKPLTKTAQYRCCGNSVPPPVAAAIVRANLPELAIGTVETGEAAA